MTKQPSDICEQCGRKRFDGIWQEGRNSAYAKASYAAIKWESYGCDSGCSGHTTYLYDQDDVEIARSFDFVHFDQDERDQESADNYYHGVAHEHGWPIVPVELDQCTLLDL